MLIVILLQIPAVQTKVSQKVASNFAKQWGTEVRIGKVNINFFETATLEDIYIEDLAGDTLLWAGLLKADIGAFAILDSRLELDEIALENAYVNLYRHEDSTKFNYEFIADSFASDTTAAVDTTASTFAFDLSQVRLENVRLRYVDDSSSMNLNVKAPYLLADLETLGLEEQFVKINQVDIRDLQGSFRQIQATPLEDTLATAPETAQALDSAFLNPSGFRVAVNDFDVKNTQFYFQTSRMAEEGTLNFENLDLRNVNIGINDFYLGGDTLRVSVEQLAAIEQNSGFVLENFAVDVALEMPMVSATLHEVITPRTRITDEIRLEQLSLKPGADMLANMQLQTNQKNSIISMQDAAYFTPMLDTMPKLRDLTLELDLDALVKDNTANVSRLHLRTQDGGLNLVANATATGLNNLDAVRFDVQVKELSTTASYLQQFSFVPDLPPAAQQAGRLNLVAQAEGTPRHVDVTARLRSGVGLLETNMLYRAPTDSRFILTGNVNATNFDMRPFVGDSLGLGKLSMNSTVRVDGKGSQIDVEKFTLMVKELEYQGYTYEGLAAEGYFVDSTLNVVAAYEDPFLNFDLLLKSDLKDSLPLVTAELNLDKLNMYRLNLSPDSIIVSTKLVAEVRGQDPDAIDGIVSIRDTKLIRGAESWTMDSLIVTSTHEGNGLREVELVSDFASAKLSGRFLFANLQEALNQCATYYCSSYKPGLTEIAEYDGQEIKLEVKMWDEPVIAKAFLPQLELLHPMTINAELRDADRAFNLDADMPGISWADSIVIKKLTIDAKTVNKIMAFDVNADNIRVGTVADIPSFHFDGKWAQDSLQFDLGLAPKTDSTHLAMGGALRIYGDTIALDLERTDLAVKGLQYDLANDATIRYAPEYLFIRNLTLGNNDQLLAITTQRETGPDPLLVAQIDDFKVGDFMDILGMAGYGLAATLDGSVTITQPMNMTALEADLMVQNLVVDSTAVGDLSVKMDKVSDNGRLNTNIALKGPGNDLTIDGFYNMEDSTNAIGLDVDINNFNLEPWEPFVKDFITELEGALQGSVDIAGSINKPQIDGSIGFTENSAFRLAMTGAYYRLQNNKIAVDNEAIRLQKFTILDSLNQQLVVAGQVGHQFFTDYRLDLSVKAQDFMAVNKAYDLDSPFYGELFVTTDVTIRGPLDNMIVGGDIRIGDRTDFALVIQPEEAQAGVASYINFVNTNAYLASDTTAASAVGRQLADSLADVASTNYFTINTTVHVPSTAEFTVVVDPNTGDFLEVQGSADLQVNMAPSGDLNMQGTFEVTEGRYRLSFMEVIQKSFALEEGSTIEFNGDPLNAEMDLTAIYTTEASRLPLVSRYVEEGTGEYAAARKKEPVNVLLSMSGTLESPTFTFDIIVPESQYGGTSSIVARRLDEIKSNESELFRQVFGLIVMNRFIPEDPGATGPGGGGAESAVASRVNETLSEFLSEQLNSLTQDYLGVELEIDIASQSENASLGGGRDVGFSLSRSLFNDKVELQIGGTSAVGGAGGAGAAGGSDTQFAGNFALLYHINERGNLNLKIFQRSERDYLTNELIPKAGAAVSYSKQFNTINGLFGREPTQREMLKSEGVIQSDAGL